MFPIIEKLGGISPVFEKLRALGFRKSKTALYMWRTRGALSAEAILLLMRIAEAERVPYRAEDFVLPSAEAAA